MKKRTFYVLLICISLFSCAKKKVNSVAEYSKWLNDPKNGLIMTRHINGLKITVKYLPSDYLSYKETDKPYTLPDSLNGYKNAISFLMNIAPDEEKGSKDDIMFRNISSYKEYSERLLSMNFEIDKNIELQASNIKLKPVLSVLENTYSLNNSRTLLIAFAPGITEKQEIENAASIDFIYEDELFQLGRMHFNFNQSNLNNLPLISQWQK